MSETVRGAMQGALRASGWGFLVGVWLEKYGVWIPNINNNVMCTTKLSMNLGKWRLGVRKAHNCNVRRHMFSIFVLNNRGKLWECDLSYHHHDTPDCHDTVYTLVKDNKSFAADCDFKFHITS